MRSQNMQRLTAQLKARYPGVTIYGVGDDGHKLSPSGHNEDDTPGSLPEDQDADNVPEHRALDVMLGGSFSRGQANEVVRALVTRPVNQRRLLYVIFDGYIWRRKNGWVREVKNGDKHRDHPHISGEADDDENGADWALDAVQAPQAEAEEQEDMKPILGKVLPKSTVWKGYGVPGSLMALHGDRAYNDVKSSLGAVELHYGGGHAGDAGTLVDVLGTLPVEQVQVEESDAWRDETHAECYARSVAAVEAAG